MTLNEIITNELVKNSSKLEIKYSCGTTPTNSEYLIISIAGTDYARIGGDNPMKFIEELETAIQELKTSHPNLHLIYRKHEFHFYYHGFNSCSTKLVPVEISNLTESEEPKKTGIVKEKYSMVGKSFVMDLIKKHPDYELYSRSGFAYRGAQESPTTLDAMVRTLDWMACADVEVIDNEIHVNAFSCNDMY